MVLAHLDFPSLIRFDDMSLVFLKILSANSFISVAFVSELFFMQSLINIWISLKMLCKSYSNLIAYA